MMRGFERSSRQSKCLLLFLPIFISSQSILTIQQDVHLHLIAPRLVFPHPQPAIVRAYTSATNHWMNLSPPFPQIDSIAEVIIDDTGRWLITGFARDGQWLEWAIQVGDAPYIET